MNSLRARIALILVSSIICVVTLATIATYFVLLRFDRSDYGTHIADQIIAVLRFANPASNDKTIQFQPHPAEGQINERLTESIRKALERANMSYEARITTSKSTEVPIASISLPQGWLIIPFGEANFPPNPLPVLVSWMIFIAIGTGCLAVIFSHRVTRHLAFLESAALAVGDDGVLPPLPERGPAEVKATARALNRMNAKLRAAVESRMRLVAAAGHDLRTPMTRMRLRAEFLSEDDRVPWLADLAELDQIADSAIQLVRVETDRNASEHIQLAVLLEEICRELAETGLPIKLGNVVPVIIPSSRFELKRALRNLAINAATHGGGALVSILRAGDQAKIVIEDCGPGIPSEAMSRAFEPFFRTDPARRKAMPGAGLGLAIAKELIDTLGGSVTLSNRDPAGLRQEVTFALAKPPRS